MSDVITSKVSKRNTMPAITLDPRLAQDTLLLGHFDNSLLLLMRNALYPWFIIVPHTAEAELYQLPEVQQAAMLRQINLVSRFITENFNIDKLNVGAIGNMVAQLHVHVVGRRRSDECWPGVVWGGDPFVAYTPEQVVDIKDKLKAFMKNEMIVRD